MSRYKTFVDTSTRKEVFKSNFIMQICLGTFMMVMLPLILAMAVFPSTKYSDSEKNKLQRVGGLLGLCISAGIWLIFGGVGALVRMIKTDTPELLYVAIALFIVGIFLLVFIPIVFRKKYLSIEEPPKL